MLSDDEISLLARVCRDHEVAYCASCRRGYELSQLGSDLFAGRRFNRCPGCGADTERTLRGHLQECPTIRADGAAGRAEAIWKMTQQRVDARSVRVAETEERAQRAVRAGGRRPAPSQCRRCQDVIEPGHGRYRTADGEYHIECFDPKRLAEEA